MKRGDIVDGAVVIGPADDAFIEESLGKALEALYKLPDTHEKLAIVDVLIAIGEVKKVPLLCFVGDGS